MPRACACVPRSFISCSWLSVHIYISANSPPVRPRNNQELNETERKRVSFICLCLQPNTIKIRISPLSYPLISVDAHKVVRARPTYIVLDILILSTDLRRTNPMRYYRRLLYILLRSSQVCSRCLSRDAAIPSPSSAIFRLPLCRAQQVTEVSHWYPWMYPSSTETIHGTWNVFGQMCCDTQYFANLQHARTPMMVPDSAPLLWMQQVGSRMCEYGRAIRAACELQEDLSLDLCCSWQ
ncbi:hypothetical protein V8B97DRAFT_1298216 [Scleroderma yunnanense]